VGTILRDLKVVLTSDQIQRRVRDIARQISSHYDGQSLTAVCVLDNGFMFMADLVRALEIPVTCRFIMPELTEKTDGSVTSTQIFYSPEINVSGQHVLLVEALLESGVTTEFLLRNLLSRGAASVKVATMLDRQSQRRVFLQPDYFGFIVDEKYLVGYGLGLSDLGRNLPYVASSPEPAPQRA
jgi:hypoxanthine phosphoribosyltransferase